MPRLGKTVVRVALGALAALMAPLAASQVVEGWDWGPGAFVVTYILFFGVGMLYAVIAGSRSGWSYKAGVGVALAAGFALGWSNMVHLSESDDPAYLVYFGVLAVGAAGAWLARLEARGLTRTLLAMAATLVLVAVLLPPGASPDMTRIAGLHAVFAALFVASALLFRHAGVAAVR